MVNDTEKSMASTVLASSDAYAIADQFALASSMLLRFRIDNQGKLTREGALLLEKCEDELDANVVAYRNKGIMLLGSESASAITEINEATKQATKFLKKIDSIDTAIKVAVGLVDLTRAILTHDVKGVVQAAKGVKDSITKTA